MCQPTVARCAGSSQTLYYAFPFNIHSWLKIGGWTGWMETSPAGRHCAWLGTGLWTGFDIENRSVALPFSPMAAMVVVVVAMMLTGDELFLDRLLGLVLVDRTLSFHIPMPATHSSVSATTTRCSGRSGQQILAKRMWVGDLVAQTGALSSFLTRSRRNCLYTKRRIQVRDSRQHLSCHLIKSCR